MAKEVNWPDEVPVLSARDICREAFWIGQTRCLLGWIGHAFSLSVHQQVIQSIQQEIKTDSIDKFNDDARNSKAKIARVWNRGMAKLGYVVGNPEAKHVK